MQLLVGQSCFLNIPVFFKCLLEKAQLDDFDWTVPDAVYLF